MTRKYRLSSCCDNCGYLCTVLFAHIEEFTKLSQRIIKHICLDCQPPQDPQIHRQKREFRSWLMKTVLVSPADLVSTNPYIREEASRYQKAGWSRTIIHQGMSYKLNDECDGCGAEMDVVFLYKIVYSASEEEIKSCSDEELKQGVFWNEERTYLCYSCFDPVTPGDGNRVQFTQWVLDKQYENIDAADITSPNPYIRKEAQKRLEDRR